MLKNWMGIFFYIGRASGQVCVMSFGNIFQNVCNLQERRSLLMMTFKICTREWGVGGTWGTEDSAVNNKDYLTLNIRDTKLDTRKVLNRERIKRTVRSSLQWRAWPRNTAPMLPRSGVMARRGASGDQCAVPDTMSSSTEPYCALAAPPPAHSPQHSGLVWSESEERAGGDIPEPAEQWEMFSREPEFKLKVVTSQTQTRIDWKK